MEGRRVLVVDDSTTLRKLVEIALRGTGCEVVFAATGGDGLARARAQPPDVILLDYLLPDLRSAEVCERLRDDAATTAVPVVIMSANQRSVLDDFRSFTSVVGYIAKPFTAEEVRARLQDAMKGRGPAARRRPTTASAVAGRVASPLELRGDLSTTSLLEILRLLVATQATGTVVIDHGATSWISLRRGEILMCATSTIAWDAVARAVGQVLAPVLRERVTRGAAVGKPALVSLEEAGAARVPNLPLELHASSVQLLGDLLGLGAGRLTWSPGPLPDFVEAFGRHLSLTAVTLDHARRTAAGSDPGVLDRSYDRTPQFSQRLAGAQLDPEEQRVLALIDGRTSGRQLAGRAKLAPDRMAAILTRLCAARLIDDGRSQGIAARTLAVLDGDRDRFVAPLRVRLARRAQPIDVVELDPGQPIAAAARAARAELALLGAAALTPDVLARELPPLARDGVTVVGVLDAPDPARAGELVRAGLHAVLAKPIHLHELERLLSV